MVFRNLFAGPPKNPELQLEHDQDVSHWRSPYGLLSRTDASIHSQGIALHDGLGFYQFEASHRLQRFHRAPAFGPTLENPRFAVGMDLQQRRRVVAALGVESPSDKPFHSLRETTLQFTAVSAPPGDLKGKKENYWLYFLNYSSTRSFLPNIPLPGASYTIPTRSGWTYSLGLPFLSISYMDFPHWSFQATGGPYFYSAALSYGPPAFQVGLSTSWSQTAYFLSERSLKEERLFIDQKEVALNMKCPLSEKLFLEGKIAYRFDQSFRTGKSYEKTTAPTEDLGSSAVFSLHLKARLDSPSDQ